MNRFIFQIISVEDGTRSPSCEGTREEFAEALGKLCSEHGDEIVPVDHLVFVVAEYREGTGWCVSQAPVMNVASFVKQFASEYVQ